MQPHIQPLPLWRRKFVFGGLLFAFLVSLPIFIFYATGYRYDFSVKNPTFTATGGFYLVADTPESEIYIDDVAVKNIRTFRSASYIQGIEPGLHRVHVQAPGAHTWVKELPVVAHLVTEAEAFNLPLVPQVRLIPEYITAANEAVVFMRSSSSPVLAYVATTTPLHFATSTATSTFRGNQEYDLIADLLDEQASSSALRARVIAEREAQRFGFSTTSQTEALPEVATTTVTRGALTLFEREGEIVVAAEAGTFDKVPHYFCAPTIMETDIITVGTQLAAAVASATPVSKGSDTQCRSEIRIDRQGQAVISFDFYPSNTNLILLHLERGVYVVEIDDRAWQNAQPLYRGEDIEMLLYRGEIFIKEGELIFEVVPEIAAS